MEENIMNDVQNVEAVTGAVEDVAQGVQEVDKVYNEVVADSNDSGTPAGLFVALGLCIGAIGTLVVQKGLQFWSDYKEGKKSRELREEIEMAELLEPAKKQEEPSTEENKHKSILNKKK